jgi:ABC-2 type transport system ATP-binding protein
VRKAFGGKVALDGVDLLVPRGSVFAMLGPNGAGKTTLVRILATLLRPDAGSVSVLGCDLGREPQGVRRRIALSGQSSGLDEELSGDENLRLQGWLLGFSRRGARERTAELLAALELEEAGKRPVRTYSGGMRRRLDLGLSLFATPDVLFLDEPTTGLDPRSREAIWGHVGSLARGGTTIVLTSQYLEEADRVADRVAVIDRGRVIAEDTARELKASIGPAALMIKLTDGMHRDAATARLRPLLGDDLTLRLEPDPTVLVVAAQQPGRPLGVERATRLLTGLAGAGIGVSEFSLGQPTLDEVFLALTGQGTHPSSAGDPT